jgi:hypothetical protein
MAAIYYNAIVLTNTGVRIKYRDITRLKAFVDFALRERNVDRIFIYRKPYRTAKDGTFAGYYNAAHGLVIY